MMNKQEKRKVLIFFLLALALTIGVVPLNTILKDASIIGNVLTKVYVSALNIEKSCDIELYEGWNLIAISCIPSNKSIDSVLDMIEGNFTSIHTYRASDNIDKWKVYKPDLPPWVVLDLQNISDKEGYWIDMVANASLNINGTITYPNWKEISPGWNLIGYPTNSSKSPDEAFSTVSDAYTVVWSYNASTDNYYYYSAILGNGTLDTIDWNIGYWINATKVKTLWII